MAIQIGTDPETGEPIYEQPAAGSIPGYDVNGHAIPNFPSSGTNTPYDTVINGVPFKDGKPVVDVPKAYLNPTYSPAPPSPKMTVVNTYVSPKLYQPGSTMWNLGFTSEDEYTGDAARLGRGALFEQRQKEQVKSETERKEEKREEKTEEQKETKGEEGNQFPGGASDILFTPKNDVLRIADDDKVREYEHALEALSPYKVDGKQYDVSRAIGNGVRPETLKTLGFSEAQIAQAKDNSTKTDKQLSLDRWKDYYFKEKGWEVPHLGKEPEKLLAYNDHLRQSTKAYAEKYGNGTYIKDVAGSAPGKLLEILPALWLLPGGNVLAVSVPITKGVLGAEGWDNVTGLSVSGTFPYVSVGEWGTGVLGAIGLTSSAYSKLVKWAEKNATVFSPEGEYVHMGDVITADKAPKGYRFIENYVDIGGGVQVVKPVPLGGQYSGGGVAPLGQIVRKGTPNTGGWVKETVGDKIRLSWKPDLPSGADIQIYTEVNPEVAKQLKEFAKTYKAIPNRNTVFELSPMSNGGFKLNSKDVLKGELLDLSQKGSFFITEPVIKPPLAGYVQTAVKAPTTGNIVGGATSAVQPSTRTMTSANLAALTGITGGSAIGIPLVKDDNGKIVIPDWATPVSVPMTKIVPATTVDPYVSPSSDTKNIPVINTSQSQGSQTGAQNQAATNTSSATKTEIKTITQTETKTETKQDTQTEEGKGQKTAEWRTPILEMPEIEQQELKKKLMRPGGRICWKQGFMWVIIKYPYKTQSDISYSRKAPEGAYVVKGVGSAYKTIQLLTGEAPNFLTVSMGAFTVTIKGTGERGSLKFTRKRKGQSHDLTLKGVRAV